MDRINNKFEPDSVEDPMAERNLSEASDMKAESFSRLVKVEDSDVPAFPPDMLELEDDDEAYVSKPGESAGHNMMDKAEEGEDAAESRGSSRRKSSEAESEAESGANVSDSAFSAEADQNQDQQKTTVDDEHAHATETESTKKQNETPESDTSAKLNRAETGSGAGGNEIKRAESKGQDTERDINTGQSRTEHSSQENTSHEVRRSGHIQREKQTQSTEMDQQVHRKEQSRRLGRNARPIDEEETVNRIKEEGGVSDANRDHFPQNLGDAILSSHKPQESNPEFEEACDQIAEAIDNLYVEDPSMSSQTNPNEHTIIFDLKSDIMEGARVEMSVTPGSISVNVHVSSDQSADLLLGKSDDLTEHLEDHETKGREIQVTVTDDRADNSINRIEGANKGGGADI